MGAQCAFDNDETMAWQFIVPGLSSFKHRIGINIYEGTHSRHPCSLQILVSGRIGIYAVWASYQQEKIDD
eukprot:scaffold33996_cov19-Prasinocladus_malaysianus.AAC.2